LKQGENIMKTRGIREIKAELDALQAEYHAKVRALKEEIEHVRESQGRKLKEKVDNIAFYEEGRSRKKNDSGWFSGSGWV
jgi:F0F1-type ATP synthase membrane subunit b/b'